MPAKSLNAITKAWTQKEKEDFAKGAGQSGNLFADGGEDMSPHPVSWPGQTPAPDANVEAMQAANLKDPSIQDKLNAVAAARAKFMAAQNGAAPAPAAAPAMNPALVGQKYPAQE